MAHVSCETHVILMTVCAGSIYPILVHLESGRPGGEVDERTRAREARRIRLTGLTDCAPM